MPMSAIKNTNTGSFAIPATAVMSLRNSCCGNFFTTDDDAASADSSLSSLTITGVLLLRLRAKEAETRNAPESRKKSHPKLVQCL